MRSTSDSTAVQRPTFSSVADSIGTLDLMILLRKDKPWSTYLGAAFMRKSTDFIGPGISAAIERSNVFGGGEKLSASVSGSYEWQTGRSPADSYSVSINSYQLGADSPSPSPRSSSLASSMRTTSTRRRRVSRSLFRVSITRATIPYAPSPSRWTTTSSRRADGAIVSRRSA